MKCTSMILPHKCDVQYSSVEPLMIKLTCWSGTRVPEGYEEKVHNSNIKRSMKTLVFSVCYFGDLSINPYNNCRYMLTPNKWLSFQVYSKT